jgi:hypothetical protein
MSNSTIKNYDTIENNIQKNKKEIKIIEQENITTNNNNEIESDNITNHENTFERLKQLQTLIQKHSCIKEICILLNIIFSLIFLLL